jgi:hypothetical protein
MSKNKKQTQRAAKQRKKLKQKLTLKQFEKAVLKKARKSGKLNSWETFDETSVRTAFNSGTDISDAIDTLAVKQNE